MDNGQLKHRLGLEFRPERVLLLQYLNWTESNDETRSATNTKNCEAGIDALRSPLSAGEEQSSPGEFTPGSESSDSWQEVDDDTDLFAKCDTIAHGLSEVFDKLFQTWLEGIRDNNGGQRASSTSGPARNSRDDGKRAEPKRKRPENSDGQDDNASPERSEKLGKKRRKMMPLDTQLACPYFKKDPRRHRACCGYGGQKLSYVKQHLNRNHTLSLYCPVCLVYFPDERLRDQHIRARTCEQLDNQQPLEGITMEQRIWLSRRGPPQLSEEQHWKRIFQYLFPGHPVPHSVYNDTTFSEEFLDFRDFISESAGLDLLLAKVRENPCWTAENEALFGPDIGQGLGQLYWLWAAARQGDSNRVVALETPVHESQDSLSPALDETVHQTGSQPRQEVITRGESLNKSTSITRELVPPVSQNEMGRVVHGREQVVYDAAQPGAATPRIESEYDCPKLDDNEDLDEVWQSSSIALTRIPQCQPRTSLTRLDQPDTEPLDLPVLGDDTQGAISLEDFRPQYLSDGFEQSEIWNFSSDFELDDTGYLLGNLGAPREDGILNSVAEPFTGTTAMTDEEATAIVTELDNCFVMPQPPE